MFARKFSSFLISNLPIHYEVRTIAKIKLDCCPKPLPPMNITIIGANSNVGRISALLLKQVKIFKKIFLYDIEDTSAIAYELNLLNTSPKVFSYCGVQNLPEAIKNTRIVFITNGIQTVPDMSEKKLFKENVVDVRQTILYCTEFNHRAMIVIASPPVPCLVPMAIEEFRKADLIADKQIFGLSTVLTSRSNALAGIQMNVDPSKLNCCVVGGNHQRTCIPVLSQIQHGHLRRGMNERITKDIQQAEEDVLYEKKIERDSRGCFLSTAYSGVKFLTYLAKALNGEPDIIECAYVKQQPPMDEYAKYFTTLVKFGVDGIESCLLPKLSELEKLRLKTITKDIKENIFIGESYITGEDRIFAVRPPKKKIVCELDMKSSGATEEKKEKIVCRKQKEPKKLTITTQ